MSNWNGTLVPNTGTVEKVYFNTNLSKEEVVSIIKNANLILVNEGYYYVLFNSDGSLGVGIETNGIDYAIFIGGEYIFNSQDNGWLEFENPFLFNQEVVSEGPGFTIGDQNEALSSLFSTTPFTQGEVEKVVVTKNKLVSLANILRTLTNSSEKFTIDIINYKVENDYCNRCQNHELKFKSRKIRRKLQNKSTYKCYG